MHSLIRKPVLVNSSAGKNVHCTGIRIEIGISMETRGNYEVHEKLNCDSKKFFKSQSFYQEVQKFIMQHVNIAVMVLLYSHYCCIWMLMK